MPTGVEVCVATVSVDDDGKLVTGFGLNVAVAPAGRPLITDRETLELKPFTAVSEIVDVALPPGAMLAGEKAPAETEKSGVAA